MDGPVFVMLLLLIIALASILGVLFVRNREHHMLHEERMAALEKGTTIPLGPPARPWSPRVYLLRGLIWTFSGLALIACLGALAATTQRPDPVETRAAKAKGVSESLGIPLDQARQMVEKDEERDMGRGIPVGIAMLGLVPLGVGLAYLLYYWTDPSRRLAIPQQ